MDQFKLAHPAFGDLEPATMAVDLLWAPLHEGPRCYCAVVRLTPIQERFARTAGPVFN